MLWVVRAVALVLRVVWSRAQGAPGWLPWAFGSWCRCCRGDAGPAGRGAPNALQHTFVCQTARPGSLCVCTQPLAVLKGTEQFYFFLSLNKAFRFIFNIKWWSELSVIHSNVYEVIYSCGKAREVACRHIPDHPGLFGYRGLIHHPCAAFLFWYIMHFHVNLHHPHFRLLWELSRSVHWMSHCNTSDV